MLRLLYKLTAAPLALHAPARSRFPLAAATACAATYLHAAAARKGAASTAGGAGAAAAATTAAESLEIGVAAMDLARLHLTSPMHAAPASSNGDGAEDEARALGVALHALLPAACEFVDAAELGATAAALEIVSHVVSRAADSVDGHDADGDDEASAPAATAHGAATAQALSEAARVAILPRVGALIPRLVVPPSGGAAADARGGGGVAPASSAPTPLVMCLLRLLGALARSCDDFGTDLEASHLPPLLLPLLHRVPAADAGRDGDIGALIRCLAESPRVLTSRAWVPLLRRLLTAAPPPTGTPSEPAACASHGVLDGLYLTLYFVRSVADGTAHSQPAAAAGGDSGGDDAA